MALFWNACQVWTQPSYTRHLLKLLNGDHAARKLLIKDLYQVGVVLKKKYALLRHAYFCASMGVLLLVLDAVAYLVMGI